MADMHNVSDEILAAIVKESAIIEKRFEELKNGMRALAELHRRLDERVRLTESSIGLLIKTMPPERYD